MLEDIKDDPLEKNTVSDGVVLTVEMVQEAVQRTIEKSKFFRPTIISWTEYQRRKRLGLLQEE